MKRIIPVLLITMLALSLNAQDDRPVRFGFSAFPSASWIVPDNQELTKEGNGLGFSYGVLVDFSIGNTANYAFATGLLINSQGGTLVNDAYHDGRTNADGSIYSLGVARTEEKYKLQYIDIPLVLKLKTNEIGYLTYFGEFGLDASFNIKARRDIEGAYSDDVKVTIDDENVSDEINLIRMALQVGAGAEFNISGNTYLMGAIVWNNGLTNIFDRKGVRLNGDGTPATATGNDEIRAGDDLKAKNNYLGLQIAVFF